MTTYWLVFSPQRSANLYKYSITGGFNAGVVSEISRSDGTAATLCNICHLCEHGCHPSLILVKSLTLHLFISNSWPHLAHYQSVNSSRTAPRMHNKMIWRRMHWAGFSLHNWAVFQLSAGGECWIVKEIKMIVAKFKCGSESRFFLDKSSYWTPCC